MTDPFAPPPAGSTPPVRATPTPTTPSPYGAPLETGARNGLGTAALVLGILGIIPFPLLFVPALLGIVFGAIGRGRVRRGEATNGGAALAGIICGVIGLVIGAVAWTGIVLLATSDSGRSLRDCLDAASTNQQAQQVCQDRFQKDLVGR